MYKNFQKSSITIYNPKFFKHLKFTQMLSKEQLHPLKTSLFSSGQVKFGVTHPDGQDEANYK